MAARKTRKRRKTAKKPRHRIPGWVAPGVMLIMTLGYATVFTATTLNEHNKLWYGNFDLGVPDQGIWLLSRFETPFLTVRGLHLFGDHASYIHILVAPIYWVWDNVKALLILHTLVLASGAIIVFFLARLSVKSDLTALVCSFSYLMFPALHFSNLDQGYHYESFTVPLILLGYYFLKVGSHRGYWVTFALAIICKEEIALSLTLFGLYIMFFMRQWKVGTATVAVSIVYALLVMNVLFPAFTGVNYDSTFHSAKAFGSYGRTMTDKIKSMTNATLMEMRLNTDQNREYVYKLLAPVAFIPVMSPAFYAATNLYINLLSDWAYSHQIAYHYVTPIIPFVYIGLVNFLSLFSRRRYVLYPLCIILVAAAFWGNYNVAPYQSSSKNNDVWWNLKNPNHFYKEVEGAYNLMEKIPKDASVCASYNLVSHLTHRKTIFMYTNPFKTEFYGVDNLQKPPDIKPEYILLDMNLNEPQRYIINNLTSSGAYRLYDRKANFDLYKRVD
ncbi:MAG: DUF2079 domain-containing protein [Candidatus Altiarchaeota archaeon]